jgi:hypothetical protein
LHRYSAVILLFCGRFTWNLHKAYAIFYLVGTASVGPLYKC